MNAARIPPWARALARFLASGALFALLAVAATRCAGYRVVIEGRHGSTRESSPVDLAPGPPQPLLDDDFTGAEARNVVLLIGDGMGFAHVLAARSEIAGLNRRLGFERMPVTGWLTTHEADSLIADSASTATAMVTGVKTARGNLSIDAEGRPLRTVLEAAVGRGMAAGLVTDSYLWDATVAAFAVHTTRRDYAEVAAQMGRSGVEILFGEACPECFGGDEAFARVVGDLENGGYAVVSSWDAVAALAPSGGKVAGLFAGGAVADRDLPPSLEQLAAFSLERLAADPDGFFLVVETEETDTASHRHRLHRMVEGIRSLDEAAAVVLDFARRDRRTLVLLTADHETGGLSLVSGDQGEKLGVRWSTWGHTGLPVPLFAYGPGAERFAGARDDTEIAQLLSRLLGLELGAS
jgi:alkaline phosphatase